MRHWEHTKQEICAEGVYTYWCIGTVQAET
jgi:hypothetical protein